MKKVQNNQYITKWFPYQQFIQIMFSKINNSLLYLKKKKKAYNQ